MPKQIKLQPVENIMTADEIVKELAIFEGYRNIRQCHQDCHCRGQLLGDLPGPQGGGGSLHPLLPSYLTSHADVMRVWCKLMGLAPIGDNAARDLVSIQAEGDGEWMSKHPNWIKAFVTAPVHKHAEVLALAIKTYKESSGV